MEFIDILIATYNGEKYIKELLNSILNQTYKNIRLLVCDDCSSDNTYKILEECRDKDTRIKLFKNDQNLGSNKTFEYLLTKVTNKYFMFADQDDVWNLDKVEVSLNRLLQEKADLVFTDLEVVDSELNLINNSFNKLKGYEYKIKKYINDGYSLEILQNNVTGCTILAKAEWIEKVLPFTENKNILYDYWIALIIGLNGKLSYVDKATIKYRQHDYNQVGAKKYTDKLKNFDEVREHLIRIRIENFNTFIENSSIFTPDQNLKNKMAYEYFCNVRDKRIINFKKINVFNELYHTSKFFCRFGMFLILNVPIIARVGYSIRKKFKNKGM